MTRDDFLKGGPEASATGVFGTAAKEPVREPVSEEEPPRVAPAVSATQVPSSPAPATNASSGGFTQLLRALNYDAVKEVQAVPCVETKGAVENPSMEGPMTQLLRTIGSPAAEVAAIEKPVSPGSSQVTSFLPPSAPVVPVSAAIPPAPAPAAGSFTQLFQTLEVEPTKEAIPEKPVEDASPGPFPQRFAGVDAGKARGMDAAEDVSPAKISAAAFTPVIEEAEAPAQAHAPVAASVSPPGSFTQMFQALDTPDVGQAAVIPAAARREIPAVSSIQPVTNEPTMPMAAPVSSPGSFTQMFQMLDAPAVEVRREVPVEPQPVVSEPGSFTQMFQTLAPPSAEEARYVPPPTVEAPKQSPVTSPGSFTQMFRTLGEEPKPQEQPPGSFTQLFGSLASSPAPSVPPPPSSYERPFAASAPGLEDGGALRMFATYREPQAAPEERGQGFSPVEAAPAGKPPSSTPSSGGLTQLLRALDQPAQTPKPYVPPSYPPPVAAPQPGSFTGVYGELGTPASAPAPVVPPVASRADAAGPSEFTRLINASAMREAALRGGGDAAAPAAPSAAAPAGGGSGFAMPAGAPAIPHASFAAPQASVAGPGGAHAGVSAAGGGQASFAAPKLPSAPQIKMPEMPKAAEAPAGIQRYVPLLLILVIFLLLAILVAVVFLMKK